MIFAFIDDESGEKAVSVLLSGEESELIFIDHGYTEMTVSAFTPPPQRRFALLYLMPSQVRSIHPFTQPLNLTDTLSVTFHNAINIYNHRRHPHNVQTTPAYRIPHSFASSHPSCSRVSLEPHSMSVISFYFPSRSLSLIH